MKYTKEELKIIEKSMYKAVAKTMKKALGTTDKGKKDTNTERQNKDVVADVMDENFSAEAGLTTPPRRTANMNKSSKGVDKLKKFKGKLNKKYEDRATTASGVSEQGIETRRANKDNSLKSGYSRSTSRENHAVAAKKIARQNLQETKNIRENTKNKKLGKKENK